ncbi:MAG: LTA synthase family protein, partial [Anaerovoracaceae bacterium]
MHYRLYSHLSKYITISVGSFYLALLLFLCAKMCLFSIVGAGVMALSAFIDSRRLRLGLPFAFMLIYLPFWADDLFLMGYFLIAFICNMLLSEYIRRTADTEASRASLIVLVFAATQLLLIDFSMHQTRNGFIYTFVSGRYDHCMYRIFSIFLIAESARLLNMFIRSLKVSSLIAFNSLFALSFINYWVYAITGKTFIFSDLHLAGTAAGVFEGVQIKTNDILFFALYVTLVVIFNLLFIRMDLAASGRKKRQKRGCLALALLIVMSVLSIGGLLSPLMYNSAVRLGFPSHLIININDSLKPSHYDEFIEKLLFREEQAMPAAKGPNIIVIMSESFSDLKEVGEFETNKDYMPYIRSIMEDYPSGILYSSVIGNNTCSSEYEFLTGVPTALTESGATIYQRYMKETEPSLVSLLEAQNYHSVGIHPYKSSGYNRKNAWEAFGFDEMHFEEDFDKAWNVRGFTSDQSFYSKIIESYESKPDQPMFCFGISMQNHATYLTDYMGDVHLTGEYRDKYPDVDEYLSLLKVTDDDTKALIDYFSAVEEET